MESKRLSYNAEESWNFFSTEDVLEQGAENVSAFSTWEGIDTSFISTFGLAAYEACMEDGALFLSDFK